MMKTNIYAILLLLSFALCASGQSNITIDITDDYDSRIFTPPIIPNSPHSYHAGTNVYANCLKYLNPANDTNVMAQWELIESLFRANNIRTGITLCSIGCSSSIHVDDVERAMEILDMAIRDNLIDNTILKMKIEAQPAGPGDPPQGVGSPDP